MLHDIFSSFDPENMLLGHTIYIWGLSICAPLMFFSRYWITSTPNFAFIMIQMTLMKLQSSRTNALNLPMMHHFLITLFIFLTSMNLLGLFPYVFSTTSHLILTLSFGLPLWLTLILSSIINAPTSYAAGLLPAGAPAWLNPFLVIIETISTGVQPGTLSFRLAANMSAGHIVMTLLSIYLMISFWMTSWKAFSILFLIQVFYFMFEAGIAMVQAYIFCLLLSLYSDAHPLN
uniref:ATP synthase subunit a n=1 Tax=Phascolosoma pacificum TaxID=1634976 RepID=A0A1D8BES7_9ANNE|nr:ATP synthase F0 subunit 6 [Phascolosoma pacificum]AOS53046.1 ATP synthase F0 subunit 6 [Phascolosoma pacificum]